VNYRKFREALEILIAYGMRDYSPANQQHGIPRNRIGVRQKSSLALPLTFQNMGRTNETSVYAAPLYGPSLRYLDLIGGYASAEDGRPTPILLASEAPEARTLVEYVDRVLRTSRFYTCIDSIDISTVASEAIDDLACHGLHPAFFRAHGHDELKRAFRSCFKIHASRFSNSRIILI